MKVIVLKFDSNEVILRVGIMIQSIVYDRVSWYKNMWIQTGEIGVYCVEHNSKRDRYTCDLKVRYKITSGIIF